MANGNGNQGGARNHPHNMYRAIRKIYKNLDPYNATGTPPYLSFDPQLEANRLQGINDLTDAAKDARRGAKQARYQKRADIRGFKTTRNRALQDTRTSLQNSLRDLGYQRSDDLLNAYRTASATKLGYSRGIADYNTRLTQGTQDIQQRKKYGQQDFTRALGVLTQNYTNLSSAQAQASNALGVNDDSTAAASAAARAQNFATQRAPLDTSLQRLYTQTGIDTSRLQNYVNTGEQRLTQDTQTKLGQLSTDLATQLHRIGVQSRVTGKAAHRQIKRARRDFRTSRKHEVHDYHQNLKDLYLKLERAIRDQREHDISYLEQEIYQAHQNHPNLQPIAHPGKPKKGKGGGGGGSGRGNGNGGTGRGKGH